MNKSTRKNASLCKAKTCRGNLCTNDKSKCIFHRDVNITQIPENDLLLFNSKGQRICGVLTSGHSRTEGHCRQVVQGSNFCAYHIKKEMERRYRKIEKRAEKEEIAEILLELEKIN